MLRHTFFTIEKFSADQSAYHADVKINAQHPVFLGHFPDQPVVPGVFTLQMIRECLEQALGKPVRFATIQNCKFSNVLIPGDDSLVEVLCNYEQNNNDIQLKASVKSGDVAYLSLKAQLMLMNED
jgi:3-hydroxyacyl-[acyl-carrier-protein] dehydratase